MPRLYCGDNLDLGNPPAIHYSSSIFSIYSPLCFYISLSDIQISVYSAFFCNPTFLDIFFCQVYITTKWARSQFCVSNGVKGNLVRHFKCVIVLQHLTLPCQYHSSKRQHHHFNTQIIGVCTSVTFWRTPPPPLRP